MPLPKIDLPVFELKIVSLPEPIKFRPFLVKEEKLMLMALQSDDENTILNTVKQVINNCLVDNIDIDSIPIFDLEYLFLNIRARSVGEVVESAFMCKNVVGTEVNEENEEVPVECKHLMVTKVNLLEVKPPINDIATKLYFTKTVGIQLNFPTIKTFRNIQNLLLTEDSDQLYELIFDCTNYVFDENNVYYKNESSYEEFSQFLEALTQEQFDKILDFFKGLPTLKIDIKHKCEKCGFDHDFSMEGLNDFFT